MKLLLHIGCEKTGTTSVQFWLHRHSDRLAEAGVQYARSLGRHNNRRISFYGLEPGAADDQLRLDGIRTAEQHARLRQTIKVELTEEVRAARAAGCSTFVISNEHCHSRQKTDAHVARIRDLLAPLFDSIEVICFLRPQVEMCLSRASTLSRNGGVISRRWIDADLDPAKPLYQFDALLERWALAFGRAQVTPVAYARTPDVVGYFERRLGVEDLQLSPQRIENPGLDYRVMAIVNGMSQGEALNQHGDFRLRRFFVNELPVEQRLTLDCDWARTLHARFGAVNAALCAAWPGIGLDDLTPDWARYPAQGTIDRLGMADEIGPFLRRMLERKHQEAAMEKAKRLSMVCDRDLALGQHQTALEACREAIALAEEAAAAEAYRAPMAQLTARLTQGLARLERLCRAGGG